MRNQWLPGDRSPAFSWFETVGDTFLRFNKSQIWFTWMEFLEDYRAEMTTEVGIERFRRLTPDWVK